MRHGGGRRDNGFSSWWLLGFGAVGVDLVGFRGWWLMGCLLFSSSSSFFLFLFFGFVGVGCVIRGGHRWWSSAWEASLASLLAWG